MASKHTTIDALVVGAGFGGIYATYRLSKLGLTARCIDIAEDVGGTWFWNTYPGAMSDTESYLYRYSWDQDDLQKYPWSRRYLYQPEILAYLRHMVERHGLRKHMRLGVEMKAAKWDDNAQQWIVSCLTGDVFAARYLINSLGVLSRSRYPDIPGRTSFAGRVVHTSRWPDDLSLANKRVGVIGNGSTGVQVLTAIAPLVGELKSYQRHPQYSVPSGQGPISEDNRKAINGDYEAIWDRVRDSYVGFGITESNRKTMEADPAERDAAFQEAWDAGNGFRFMFGAFGDLAVDRCANEEACKFIRRKIGGLVKDPRKADILKPRQLYARRPVCDSGYYSIFNRDNVDVIDLMANPIAKILPEGIAMSDGTVHGLDVLVFATGFDAVVGSYQRVAITGRDGKTLSYHWENGPTAYGAVACSGFPNMFLVSGPQGPFANFPPVIESEMDLIMACIEIAEGGTEQPGNALKARSIVETTPEAEAGWSATCLSFAKGTLFWGEPGSWIFGANMPGREPTANFYLAGLSAYRAWVRRVIKDNLSGFTQTAESGI